jgi:uncharacterized repeat protein (TIGR03847 family)
MELERVDRITADAVGEPGHRTFLIQARKGAEVVTILVEKEQVQLLAASILEVLSRLDAETATTSTDDLGIEEPAEPVWRAGRLSIGYDEERDLILLEIEELVPEDEEAEPETLRLWATREQMLALSSHGAEVSSRGRPKCELCGNPMDPEGHACPATNGHKTLGR